MTEEEQLGFEHKLDKADEDLTRLQTRVDTLENENAALRSLVGEVIDTLAASQDFSAYVGTGRNQQDINVARSKFVTAVNSLVAKKSAPST